MKDARKEAAEILLAWKDRNIFPGRQLASRTTGSPFETALVLGVVRWDRALRWMLDRWTKQRPNPLVEVLIEMGLFQLFFLDDVQPYAAVNESVRLARALGAARQTGFINAVLRRAQREQKAVLQALEQQPPGIRFSHPELLIDRWMQREGAEAVEALCRWNNEPAETVIRIRLSRVSRDAFVEQLTRSGIEVVSHPAAPASSLILPRGVRVRDVPGYDEGLFYVQDPSTHLAVELLDPRPGERILDACAAPGGKTLLLADALGNAKTITALERHADRLARLRQNLGRAGCRDVRVVRGDARRWRDAQNRLFDAILLDAPCMNTGVLRRRPDARWRFSLSRLQRLTALQTALLDQAASLLRPGGRLVYSTCSLEEEENGGLVRSWLERHPEFALTDERRLFPPRSKTDGAYAARLER